MYKNHDAGTWEHDFRVRGVPRYHISYGAIKKDRAAELHSAVTALFSAKEMPVIEALRRGDVTPEQVKECRDSGRPFSTLTATATVVVPWPELSHATEEYLGAMAANPNRKASTTANARVALNSFMTFVAQTVDGDIRLDEVTSQMVTSFQTWLRDNGQKPNTIGDRIMRIGAMFRWFLRREIRTASELKHIPRHLHIPIDPETTSTTRLYRSRFLSELEAERLLAATPAQLLFPVAAGLFGGFRVEEMCHLRTAFDVDLKLGVLSVQRQPNWTPKTKRSVRNVPIASVLRPIVEYHLERFASDEWMTPNFRHPLQPLRYRTFAYHFERIVNDADLVYGTADEAGVTYHTLRHTFASWLLMRGTDVFTVAKLLGNTVQQVENTYGHLALDFRRAAVDRLSGAIQLPTLDSGDDQKNATANATMEAT